MSVEVNLNFFAQIVRFNRKKNKYNILPSGTRPLSQANDCKDFFIDKIDQLMRGFQTFPNSEDVFFSISDFPLVSMCILAPATVEQLLIFIKKN